MTDFQETETTGTATTAIEANAFGISLDDFSNEVDPTTVDVGNVNAFKSFAQYHYELNETGIFLTGDCTIEGMSDKPSGKSKVVYNGEKVDKYVVYFVPTLKSIKARHNADQGYDYRTGELVTKATAATILVAMPEPLAIQLCEMGSTAAAGLKSNKQLVASQGLFIRVRPQHAEGSIPIFDYVSSQAAIAELKANELAHKVQPVPVVNKDEQDIDSRTARLLSKADQTNNGAKSQHLKDMAGSFMNKVSKAFTV